MTAAEQRQSEVDELASSLSETLALHFPQGSPINDEKLVKRWLGELVEATPSDSGDSDTAGEIMRLAVQKWKAREPGTASEPSKATLASFSLLDQLSSMPKRVFFDQIEAAKSPSERLQLLQQVDHVDDVATEWKKVLSMLFEGLTEGGYVSDYIELHGKWFDQCGSSMEYTSIQFGLCSNLIKALQHYFGNRVFVSQAESLDFTSQQEFPYKMMQQWHVMWMSAMNNFALENCNEMARQVMQLMRNVAPGTPVKFVLLPAHLMALIDPYAKWFALWIGHAVSPGDALDSLLSTGLFYDLMQRCGSRGYIPWKEEPSTDTCNAIVIQQGNNVEVWQLERALFVQSLSMVRSILVSTRVALFPWREMQSGAPTQVSYTSLLRESSSTEKVAYKPTICVKDPTNEIMMALDCFLTVIRNPKSDAKLTSICCEALETILWGFQSGEHLRDALRTIADIETVSALSVAAGRDLFSLLLRVYSGTDWSEEDKEAQEKVIEFLKLLREHCGLDSANYLESIEFEAILQKVPS